VTAMVPWTSRPVVGSGAALFRLPVLPGPYFKSLPRADDKSAPLLEHGLMAFDLILFVVLRVSGLLMVLLLAASMLLKGGWDAVVVALGVGAGMTFALSLIVLLVTGEGTSDRARH
jgi:hypothetical protein